MCGHSEVEKEYLFIPEDGSQASDIFNGLCDTSECLDLSLDIGIVIRDIRGFKKWCISITGSELEIGVLINAVRELEGVDA